MQATATRRTLSADKVIGSTVYEPSGNGIGEVKDLIFDGATGLVHFMVVGFRGGAGMFGAGTFQRLIPLRMFYYHGEGRLTLDMDTDRLGNAPGYNPSTPPDLGDEQQMRSVYDYYGVPYEPSGGRQA